jgi:HTH-type transcriptional regulator/antitoxin HigA
MYIRPTRNKADHRAALAEVERLWAAEPGTPEGDDVEVLTTLIEAYEAREPSHPAARPDRRDHVHDGTERVDPARSRAGDRQPRPPTLPMVRALSPLLDIPLEILGQPYETRPAA